MISQFAATYFPRRMHKGIGLVLLLVMTAYLISIPIVQDPKVYSIFHYAAKNFIADADPYLTLLPGGDYYKYGPAFLLFPLVPLSVLPVTAGAVVWQILGLVVYLIGAASFFGALATKRFRSTTPFALVFAFTLFYDLGSNGVLCQSNTILVGGILLALACYMRKRYVASGILFAFFCDMKILPLAFALLLALEFKPRYLISFAASLAAFVALPFLFKGVDGGLALYKSWAEVLLIDRGLVYGDWSVYFLGIKGFLENNFGVVLNGSLTVAMLAFGIFFAVVFFFWKRPYTPSRIALMTALVLGYILLFNTRTEGASFIFMAPVYSIFIYGITLNRDRFSRAGAVAAYAVVAIAFFLSSLSTSDLTGNTPIAQFAWDHNIRTLGVAILFVWALLALVTKRFAVVFDFSDAAERISDAAEEGS